MIRTIQEDAMKIIMHARIQRAEQVAKPVRAPHGGEEAQKPKTVVNNATKIGRNDPCPCGSGKKYKTCCGRN